LKRSVAAIGRRWLGAELVPRLASVLVLLLAWQVGAALAGSRALPSPASVAAFIATEAQSGELARNVGATLARVAASFALAMALGTITGILLGRSIAADRVFDPWLGLLLNTPALVVTVLCYVWLGLTETAAIAAVTVNKLPNVAVIVREGARSIDPQLEEMRRAFRFDTATWIRHVLLPQLQPYIVAAARSGLSLAWKIVLVAELLGRPNGVGYAISYHFQLFDIAALFGYSLVFTSVMLALDFLVLRPIETHAARWRIVPA
jgi:NitT/TauT family transport system permease protein